MNKTTLDRAQEAFEANPTPKTIAAYMSVLMEYEADDMIGDDTWMDGLADIRRALEKL